MNKSSVVYWSSGTSLEREENKDGEGGEEREVNIKQWEHYLQGHMVLFLYPINKLWCRTPLWVNQRI